MTRDPATEKPVETDSRKASKDLKARIDEAKARNDMPLNASLGNPKWEQHAADGHLDVPDNDEN